MANGEHLAILKNGPNAWNKWRRNQTDIAINFEKADLSGANLSMADLNRANLEYANLSGANLAGANLVRSHLDSADLSGANLNGANLDEANIWEADLSGANLGDVLLTGARLVNSDLRGADLSGSDLSLANLHQATLVGANLSGVNFTMADLSDADLRGANLAEAELTIANLSDARLSGATILNTVIGGTLLINTDLSPFVNAEVEHESPSSIDHRSIARALQCVNLLPFLVATGMPHIFATYAIDAIRSLDPNGLFNLMYSTFISHGGPDEAFAITLQEALQSNGVTTYLFKKDAVPGQALSDVMRDQVRDKDRIVLICSQNSLTRPGVLNEMNLAIKREAREGGHTLLIPIALDRYVFDEWDPENENLKEAVLERVIADFIGAKTDKTKFDQGIERLLKALHVS